MDVFNVYYDEFDQNTTKFSQMVSDDPSDAKIKALNRVLKENQQCVEWVITPDRAVWARNDEYFFRPEEQSGEETQRDEE